MSVKRKTADKNSQSNQFVNCEIIHVSIPVSSTLSCTMILQEQCLMVDLHGILEPDFLQKAEGNCKVLVISQLSYMHFIYVIVKGTV